MQNADASSERVSILCQDIPYPPHDGGKLDLWNLIRGLHRERVTVQLVCWFREKPIEEAVKRELLNVAVEVVEVRRCPGWWRGLHLVYPPRMVSFKPSTQDYAELRSRVQAFAPDWILLDSWLGYLTARALSTDLRKPFIYRSQNVEHKYHRDQRRLAKGTLKVKLIVNSIRLAAVEREIRQTASLVADISDEDRAEWSQRGAEGHSLVIRPIWFDSPANVSIGTVVDIDLLFVGNLRTPNNVEGLRWFTSEVLPIIRRKSPQALRVVFAGSDPDSRDLTFWRFAGIQCDPNPRDVSAYYQRTSVVINPVQHGSGVNLKMVEAFSTGKPIVGTPVSVRGLPNPIRATVSVCDSATAFAAAALEALTVGTSRTDRSTRAVLLDRYFGPSNAQALIRAVAMLRQSQSLSS
ncbi:MAG: glycosyltransferase [Vicinamibacterales bacterium]